MPAVEAAAAWTATHWRQALRPAEADLEEHAVPWVAHGTDALRALADSQLVSSTDGYHRIDLDRATTVLVSAAAAWLPGSRPPRLLSLPALSPAIVQVLETLARWAAGQPCPQSCERNGCAPLLTAAAARMPSLFRLLATRLTYWSHALAELDRRLEQDRPRLQHVFGLHGEVVRLDFPAGDEHHRGRATAVLHFASGGAVVYKPRPQSLIIRLRNIAAQLRDHSPALAVSFPEALDQGDYGWAFFVEAIDPADQPDLPTQFRRLGQAAALTWALAGRDIHLGNIVLSDSALHIIDEEVFGLGVVTDNPALPTPLREELRFFESSPVHTGVFPYLTPLPGRESGIDFSPYSRLRAALTPARPTPTGPQELLDADAVAFLHGYEEMLQAFGDVSTHNRAFRQQVEELTGERCRLVPLPTARYGELLAQSLTEERLASGSARESFFTEQLHADSAFKPWRGPLVPEESADLFDGDVPLFHAPVDSRLVRGLSRNAHALLDHTGATVLQHRTARLAVEMPALLWQATASLECAARNRGQRLAAQSGLTATTASADPGLCVDASHTLLSRLRDLAVQTLDGHLAWADVRHDMRRKWHIGHAGTSIRSGSSGILLASLLLRAVPQTRLATTADDLTSLLADPWLDETEQLTQDEGVYVLSELCERLLVATELLHRTAGPRTEPVLRALLSAIRRSLPYLKSHPDQDIAPALLALAAAAGTLPAGHQDSVQRLLQQFDDGSTELPRTYDALLARHLIARRFPHLPLLQPGDTAVPNVSAFFPPWISGAFPEHAARLVLAETSPRYADITADIVESLRVTTEHNHGLANGTAGRISLLTLLGESKQAALLATQLATLVLAPDSRNPDRTFDPAARPGLLTGMAGTAYELARSASGGHLPSLLLPAGLATGPAAQNSPPHLPRTEENHR
ncbi:type 2 lanthipeptide synthetase LanM [Streptomyces spororaveus]|uniref:type 2 lanthipeptide synthetase LanM n=5 Tax=Streptomyces spororaveus TaxID=284039 RepID=UPI0031DCF086